MTKELSHTLTLRTGSVTEVGDEIEDVDQPNGKTGTKADLRDMIRMGKTQEFSRNFGFLSIVGFSIVSMVTWQAETTVDLTGTADGGLANLVWSYVVVFFCWCCVVASMSEMASMAPTSGGQFHWVSEFAPPRISRLLSFVTGWSCIVAWQMAFAAIVTSLPGDVQSLITLSGSTFVLEPWQVYFVLIALAALAVIFNTNVASTLPLVGGALVLFYICGFFAILIPLWVLAPRTDPGTVFLSFSNRGDTGGIAHSLLFGIFAPMYAFMAPDSAIHMSEEVKDSSLVLPRAMMTSFILNGILGFIMLLTICFTVGDIDALFSSAIGGHVQIFLNATNSPAAAMIMGIIIEIVEVATTIVALTSASRQLFAFARDGGVPYSSFLAHIRPGWKVPLNAILTTFVICLVINVINLGSSVVIDTVVTASVTGNISSYIMSIACVRLKRWRNEPLPPHRWSLGKWGAPINDVAILFLCLLFVVFCIPQAVTVTTANMNYSSVVFVGMLVMSLIFYYVKGRHSYVSPVTLVQKYD